MTAKTSVMQQTSSEGVAASVASKPYRKPSLEKGPMLSTITATDSTVSGVKSDA